MMLLEYPALTRMFANALLTTTVTVHGIRVARGWRVLRAVPNNSVPPCDELLFGDARFGHAMPRAYARPPSSL